MKPHKTTYRLVQSLLLLILIILAVQPTMAAQTPPPRQIEMHTGDRFYYERPNYGWIEVIVGSGTFYTDLPQLEYNPDGQRWWKTLDNYFADPGGKYFKFEFKRLWAHFYSVTLEIPWAKTPYFYTFEEASLTQEQLNCYGDVFKQPPRTIIKPHVTMGPDLHLVYLRRGKSYQWPDRLFYCTEEYGWEEWIEYPEYPNK